MRGERREARGERREARGEMHLIHAALMIIRAKAKEPPKVTTPATELSHSAFGNYHIWFGDAILLISANMQVGGVTYLEVGEELPHASVIDIYV